MKNLIYKILGIVVITDDAPLRKEEESEKQYRKRCVMKLQNELIASSVLKVKNGKIILKAKK